MELGKRFWDKVDIRGIDDCWEWKAFKGKNGYGKYSYNGKAVSVHRLSYLESYGSIDDNLLVIHSCDNPSCVNPRHLRQGTHVDNIKDMIKRGRYYSSTKTHCKHGHEFTPENTIIRRGQRECAKCRKLGAARRYQSGKTS